MTDEGQGPPEDLAHHSSAGPVEVVTGLSRAYKGVLAGTGFVAVFVLILLWGSNRPANPTFLDEATTVTTAGGPAFADKSVAVGPSSLKVLVADTKEKRAQGLRDRNNLEGHGGMIFEFPDVLQSGGMMDHNVTRFTMSGVRFPLTIGFYDEGNQRVDAVDMEPCSASDGSCPSYGSKGAFKSAIETPKGKLPDGPLAACPS
ncbi:MAG: DUF192 domain-containing protein [Acidimicrobiia bacterium]